MFLTIEGLFVVLGVCAAVLLAEAVHLLGDVFFRRGRKARPGSGPTPKAGSPGQRDKEAARTQPWLVHPAGRPNHTSSPIGSPSGKIGIGRPLGSGNVVPV
jgi:hypothetical protein